MCVLLFVDAGYGAHEYVVVLVGAKTVAPHSRDECGATVHVLAVGSREDMEKEKSRLEKASA